MKFSEFLVLRCALTPDIDRPDLGLVCVFGADSMEMILAIIDFAGKLK